MQRRTRWIATAGLAVAMAGGIAAAAAGGDTDQELTGATRDRAVAAALAATGGGTVLETEAGDDGAAYGVEVRLADGRQVEVNLDEASRSSARRPTRTSPGRTRDDDPRRPAARLGIGLVLALAVAACGSGGRAAGPAPAPASADAAAACVKKEQGTGCLPLAPEGRRVDRSTPVFSKPTEITNPLFPIAEVDPVAPARHRRRQAVPGRGHPAPRHQDHHLERPAGVDAHSPVRRLLRRAHPRGRARLVRPGRRRVGLVLRRGRLQLRGRRRRRHPRHLAGRQGRPAGHDHARQPAPRPGLPAREHPRAGLRGGDGEVHRPARARAKGSGRRRRGHPASCTWTAPPRSKTFAPGYGEFSAGGGGDLEEVALAVPADAAGGSLPPELAALAGGARSSFDAAGAGRWAAASSEVDAMDAAWKRVRRTGDARAAGRPDDRRPRHAGQGGRRPRPGPRPSGGPGGRAGRPRPPAPPPAPAEVDLDRLDLWARQLQVDAAAGDRGAVAGDVATLQTVWDRVGHTADPAAAARVGADLAALGRTADGKDLGVAAAAVSAFRESLSAVRP